MPTTTYRFTRDPQTVIAEHDFIQPRFDNAAPHPLALELVVLLVSTPRSGSTYLCEGVFESTGLVCHEYLQPHQYMPWFALGGSADYHRPGTVHIRLEEYLVKLIRKRAKNGVLAVNLHVSHLALVDDLLRVLAGIAGNPRRLVLGLLRRDLLAQAVSHWRAHEQRVWSATHMDADRTRMSLSAKARALAWIDARMTALGLETERVKCMEEAGFIQRVYFHEDLFEAGSTVVADVVDQMERAAGARLSTPGERTSRDRAARRLVSQSTAETTRLRSTYRTLSPFMPMVSLIMSSSARVKSIFSSNLARGHDESEVARYSLEISTQSQGTRGAAFTRS